MNNQLLERLKKASKIDQTAVLSESLIVNRTTIDTGIPALNIALSGSLDKGLTSGITTICGPSRNFKSMVSLVCAAAYLRAFEDAVLIFYDSEMGASTKYFESAGIDPNRVLHVPITDIEILKFDMMSQLEELKRGDHVVFVIDSLGNLASKKETQDAIDAKAAADMTRARSIKGLTRLITPQLGFKDLPCIIVNHTYKDISNFVPQDVLGGGTGVMYSSDSVILMGKSQQKSGTEVVGYNFTMNIMKSRFVREKSKIPLTVTYAGGINKWSGLLDIALLSGDVVSQTKGWYQRVNDDGEVEEKRYRANDTNKEEFWQPIINGKRFNDWICRAYTIANAQLLANDQPIINTEDLL